MAVVVSPMRIARALETGLIQLRLSSFLLIVFIPVPTVTILIICDRSLDHGQLLNEPIDNGGSGHNCGHSDSDSSEWPLVQSVENENSNIGFMFSLWRMDHLGQK